MARGRKPRRQVRSTEKVETRLTVSERIDLDLVAAASGKSVASVVRDAVNRMVASQLESGILADKIGTMSRHSK